METIVRDGLVASLVASGTVRGENWTIAVFRSSGNAKRWTGHVLFAGDGEVSIGFETAENAARWAVETLGGYLDAKPNRVG